jgi:hypothetical protein
MDKYWRGKHEDLSWGIRERQTYTSYLRPEPDPLARIPAYIDEFLPLWHAKERTEGKRWLIANCATSAP